MPLPEQAPSNPATAGAAGDEPAHSVRVANRPIMCAGGPDLPAWFRVWPVASFPWWCSLVWTRNASIRLPRARRSQWTTGSVAERLYRLCRR
jgi:hypothetical protein